MYLGVDIGGTKILALILGPKGQVLSRHKKKIKEHEPEAVIRRAWQAARAALREAGLHQRELRGVGLAVPSAVDGGVAHFAPALGWREVEVQALAQTQTKAPVFVGNDVNLGLAAEYVQGAARGKQLVVGFFIGTGIGGAIICKGKLLKGKDGMAGELGHITVVPGGRACGCGNQGCLEAYASKTALLGRLKQALFEQQRKSTIAEVITPQTRMITSGQLLAAYKAKDRLVREVFDEGLSYMGPALASMIAILSPARIVLGGGVIEAFGAPLVKRIRKAAAPQIFGGARRARIIVQSALGDDAVPLGAALLARSGGQLL